MSLGGNLSSGYTSQLTNNAIYCGITKSVSIAYSDPCCNSGNNVNGPVASRSSMYLIAKTCPSPTPADFAQMMNTSGGGAVQPAAQGDDQWGSSYQAPQPRQVAAAAPKRSWIARSMDEFRVAFFVTILVFVFSLPVVNFLFAHYVPSLVKSTGELTLIGLLAKSFAAGISFWVLQRVIVPLLSL